MDQTTNLKLNVITTADDMAVRDFFMALAGRDNNSNMEIIDKEIQELKTAQPSEMTGATDQKAGNSGIVPAPSAGDQEKYLRGDGNWQDPMSDYDPDGVVKSKGGIPEYVDSKTDVFWANVSKSGSAYICDKTFSEFVEADSNGKLCAIRYVGDTSDSIYYLTWKSETVLIFDRYSNRYIYEININSDNSITYKQVYPETTAARVSSGTFPGTVIAGSQSAATSLLRNTRILSATEAESITPAEGEIIWVYE